MIEHEYKTIAVAEHHGVFQRQLSLFEAVALILSGTIGAGILGIPYAIAKVGIWVGLAYIVGIGLLMMGLNILIGEVAIRAKMKLQLAGLAAKYLGTWGKWLMTAILYALLFGVLLVYIIGAGEGLMSLFGGAAFWWSIIFLCAGSVFIFSGIRTIKIVELFLNIDLLLVVLVLALFLAPQIRLNHFWSPPHWQYLLFPYGVILFAFHATTTIPEAHSLLADRDRLFQKAILYSGIITMIVYAFFAIIVYGVTGPQTTEIATIGLGKLLGPVAGTLGNLFAVIAMGTSFLVTGLGLRNSLEWDYHAPAWFSTIIVCGVPFGLFLLGIRRFVATINVIGGVFMSIEMLLLLLIYWRAHAQTRALKNYGVQHVWLVLFCLTLALSAGAVYSIFRFF